MSTGGSATIKGVNFEKWIVVFKIIDVLYEDHTKLKFQAKFITDNNDDLKKNSVDDICVIKKNKIEYYNCKYQAPNKKYWNLNSLKSKGVIEQLKSQFKKTPDAFLYFVTKSPCIIFQEVLNRGKACKSRNELEIKLKSNDYIKNWDSLKNTMKMTDNELIEFSNQVKFMRINIDEINKLIIKYVKKDFKNYEYIPSLLLQFVEERGIEEREITKNDIISFLEQYNIFFRDTFDINNKSNLPQRDKFINREIEKKEFLTILNKKIPTICVDGMPGIGKSDFVIECGKNALNTGMFEHVIWNQDNAGELELNEVLDQICFHINQNHAVKLSLSKKKYFINKQLSLKKYLVIIDNHDTILDQNIVKYAINCPYPSKFLFTSRDRISDKFYNYHLGPFDDYDNAIQLIKYWISQTNYDYNININNKQMYKLANKTGKNPQAMKLVINDLINGGSSIESVFSDLNGGTGYVFNSLYNRLWERISVSSKIILKIISFLPSYTNIESIQEISKLNRKECEKAVKELTTLCLLEPSIELSRNKRRYKLHQLTRNFAKNKLHNDKIGIDKIRNRCISHWLNYSQKHGGMEWDWGGYGLIIEEIENIFQAIELCVELKRWNDIILFRDYLSNPLSIRGYWEKRKEIAKIAIMASEKIGNLGKKAQILIYDISYIDLKIGELDKAKENIKEGLGIIKNGKSLKISQMGINFTIAAGYHHLGKIEQIQQKYRTARNYYRDSLELYKVDEEYKPFLISELAITYFDDKKYKYRKAKNAFEKALGMTKGKSGKTEIVRARCLGFLGEINKINKNFVESINNYKEALNISRKIGRADEIAINAFRLAKVLFLEQKNPSALLFAEEALNTYRQMGDLKNKIKVKNLIKNIKK